MDKSGQCPAVHAAMHGHLDALIFLLQCDWSEYDGQLTKVEAMQQAMVASAATGHTNVSARRFVSRKSTICLKSDTLS